MVLIFLYQEVPIRIIGYTKMQDQQFFQGDFIPVQKGFCRPYFRKAANMYTPLVVADAFLDHIRYSGCMI